MSVAFTKEDSAETAAETQLPDRPVSPHPNLVTAAGLQALERQLDEARRLYAPARVHYERIEPIAELFNDLDGSIDARADDFEKKEQDPTWTGFHRLEKALFADKATDGLDAAADHAVPVLPPRPEGLATEDAGHRSPRAPSPRRSTAAD